MTQQKLSPLDTLRQMPCRRCGGEKGIYATERQRGHYEPIPCPDCQDQGQPTGLEFWMLTVECPGCDGTTMLKHGHGLGSACWKCQGSGRVPIPEGMEVGVLRETLKDNGWMCAAHNDYMQDGKWFTFWLFVNTTNWKAVKGESETDVEALAAALLRSVEAGTREVTNIASTIPNPQVRLK